MELNCFRFAAAKVARSVSKPWAPLASSVGSGSASSVPCRKFTDAGTQPSRRPDNRSGQNTILFAWFLPFFLWIDHWGAKCASQCVSKSTLHLTWPCPNTTLPELQRNISVKDNLNFVPWPLWEKAKKIRPHCWPYLTLDRQRRQVVCWVRSAFAFAGQGQKGCPAKKDGQKAWRNERGKVQKD